VKEASIEQAAAIQESVSALTEMGSMIAQTSQNVALSRESSDATRALAENSKQTMERLAHSLSAIQKSNTQLQELQKVIEDINSKTAVINDIVFKTQLLSFNASIEAARAGQHGRGFAVVAEEVGSLADMSGQAARDITTLLEASQNKVRETLEMIQARVQDGNKVGQLAIRAFDEISEGVAQINAQVRAIGEATQQQEIGVQQTNTAMRQMDVTSQSNAEASTVTLSQAGSMSMDCVSLNAALSDLLSLIGAIPPSSAAKLAAPKSTVGVTRMSAPSSSDDLEDLATKVVAMSRGGGASKKNARDLPSADHPSFKKAG
jgi:methyl-accepting chemotaxis protein